MLGLVFGPRTQACGLLRHRAKRQAASIVPRAASAGPAAPSASAPAVETPAPLSSCDGAATSQLLENLHERCQREPFAWTEAAGASETLTARPSAQPSPDPPLVLEEASGCPIPPAPSPASSPSSPSSASPRQPSCQPYTVPVSGAPKRAAAPPPPAASVAPSFVGKPHVGVPPPTPTPPSMSLATTEVTTETDEHCSATHPGSMCCTSTAVEKDSTATSCVVTVRTTVTLTDSRLHVASSELEELAWLAARDAAEEAVGALNRRSTRGPEGREERHRFVCNMLRHGRIRETTRMENGFGHVSYQVTLEDKTTGKRIRAAFKPRVEGDCEGWHRVPIEVAAYQLNLLLGMDVVPPAVTREDCDVDWTHYPMGGAFIYWCSNARQLDQVPMHEWSVPSAVLLSDTRILDVLIQNSDRHAGHFLYAEHWADGDYVGGPQGQGQQSRRGGAGSSPGGGGGGGGGSGGPLWRGRLSPVLIDHAAGFRADAFVSLDHENAFITGPTHRISARTYLRLRFLDAPSLRACMRGILSDEEVAALLARRDAVLAFFDSLVAEKGYDKVVLEA
ncbi:hypothetical protein HYH03_018804 [Edaphochlamys debaryana]|uniref:PI3K/PI4K catalytic domain-containing protein n=1 Tax=Edaphochlamys debaryana TaxID=47281 RepID=A0A836BMK9_9CHLO|nr:hypothetical protein HYH03_018804 [Edaphochlamys debaryana]|eukprot:KAG2482261.1 hypothetical protein HYH03_018804 [Edaphochlamys debaryana]